MIQNACLVVLSRHAQSISSQESEQTRHAGRQLAETDFQSECYVLQKAEQYILRREKQTYARHVC